MTILFETKKEKRAQITLAQAARLADHYKSVRACMGMGPKLNVAPNPRAETQPSVRAMLVERERLQSLIDSRSAKSPKSPVSMRACFLATAQHFELTLAEMIGRSRAARLVLPRHIAFYVTRELTGNSLPQIGTFARRDHTSVLHGCAKIERMISAGSEDIRRAVDEIKARLDP